MIWRIARKEFLEISRDGRFLWTGALIVLLLIVSLAAAGQRYAEDRNLRQQATAEVRQQWLTQGDKGPHAAAHYGTYAFKPATPLALFDPGYNDYTGTIQYLEAHKENTASFKPAADATALQRFGDLSGAMVLQILVPLLIILLCFGMISGEREDGTLRQLLSIGVRRSTLVIGKGAGAAMAIGLVLLPALAIGGGAAAVIASGNDPHEMAGFGIKLTVLILCYLAFFATIICLSIAASSIARTSGSALTILIGFWIVAGLLLPRLGADISKRLYPTPSNFEVAAAIEAGRNGGVHPHELNHPNRVRFVNETLAKYHVKRVEDLPFNFTGYALQTDEEIGFKVFDQQLGGVRRQFERQDQVQQLFSALSPFVAIKALSSALSGTDVAFANDFENGAEGYRRNMIRVLNQDLMNNAVGMNDYSSEWGYRAGANLWKKVPPFDYDPPAPGIVLSRCISSLVILTLWLVGSAWLLIWAARKTAVEV